MTVPPIRYGPPNLILNSSTEANLDTIQAGGAGVTLSLGNEGATLGTKAVHAACDGTSPNQGVIYRSATGMGTSTARTFQGRIDVSVNTPTSLQVFLRVFYNDGTSLVGSISTVPATTTPQRVTPEQITTGTDKPLNRVAIFVRNPAASAVTIRTDDAVVTEIGATRSLPGFLVPGTAAGPLRIGKD